MALKKAEEERKEREEEERRRKEKLAKKKEEERKAAEPQIRELTNEEAEQMQKEIEEKVLKLLFDSAVAEFSAISDIWRPTFRPPFLCWMLCTLVHLLSYHTMKDNFIVLVWPALIVTAVCHWSLASRSILLLMFVLIGLQPVYLTSHCCRNLILVHSRM